MSFLGRAAWVCTAASLLSCGGGADRPAAVPTTTRARPVEVQHVVTVKPKPVPKKERVYYREAYCTAFVEGVGEVDVETDYLPHVVACENGTAPLEALKAQAVAARSYLYYYLERDGFIGDGQHAQVYRCSVSPKPEHYEAVRETRGQVLTYANLVIPAFYVAGALPDQEDCSPSEEAYDPFATELFVTYNWDRAGSEVWQSRLAGAEVEPVLNRGCHSQQGANCLASRGVGYEDILRFYYGMDVVGDIAFGPCVDAPDRVFSLPLMSE